jgi:hypothetical protein
MNELVVCPTCGGSGVDSGQWRKPRAVFVSGGGGLFDRHAELILREYNARAVFVLAAEPLQPGSQAMWDVAARDAGMVAGLPNVLAEVAHMLALKQGLQLEVTVDGRPIYR